MGTHTYGSLTVTFSRELEEQEFRDWIEVLKDGYRDEGSCHNPKHDEAPLHDGKCEHFDDTPNAGGYCYVDWERYNPADWSFADDTFGDIGIWEMLDNGAFTIRSEGKVYDLEDAARFAVAHLPADVTATGTGYFDSDGEPWLLVADGRTVESDNVVYVPQRAWQRVVDAAERQETQNVLRALRDLFEVIA